MWLSKLREMSNYALYTPERPRYQSRTMRNEWVSRDAHMAERYDQWRAQQSNTNALLAPPKP